MCTTDEKSAVNLTHVSEAFPLCFPWSLFFWLFLVSFRFAFIYLVQDLVSFLTLKIHAFLKFWKISSYCLFPIPCFYSAILSVYLISNPCLLFHIFHLFISLCNIPPITISFQFLMFYLSISLKFQWLYIFSSRNSSLAFKKIFFNTTMLL